METNEEEYQKHLKELRDAKTPLSLVPMTHEEAIRWCDNKFGMNAILGKEHRIILGKMHYRDNTLVLFPQGSDYTTDVRPEDEIYWIGLQG